MPFKPSQHRNPFLTMAAWTVILLVSELPEVLSNGFWLIKGRRTEFFLAKGRLDAPIGPVRWLGIRKGESWRAFGWIFALAAGFGILVFVAASLRPSPEVLLKAVPLLPVVLLLAALNAFSEEICFHASLLSTLHEAVGREQALLINAVFFGLAHYLYGSPSGVIGFLLTGSSRGCWERACWKRKDFSGPGSSISCPMWSSSGLTR